MRLIRRLKRTTKQYIIVALICITVIGSAAIITFIITTGQIREEYEYMLNEAQQELKEHKRTVYISQSDISRGEILTMDKVELSTVYSAQPSDSYITKDEIGKAAMINIPKGTHIVKGMLAKNLVSSVLREVGYDVIHMSPNIEVNDYVDIRILYPNGENYIVISKKPLKGIWPDSPLCFMWVEEEEILRMSAAIVDAALYRGSKLFMTKYIEPNIQDASIVTYTPNISVLSLIEEDPNIVERCSQLLNKEVRKAMENRLAESLGLDVSMIDWELDDAFIGRMYNISPAYHEGEEANLNDCQDTGSRPNQDGKESEPYDKGQVELGAFPDINSVDFEEDESWYFPDLGVLDRSKNYDMATEG
ncbi:MAG: flagella basal body P-ring formation protein FlgA [Clostridiales bacterium]|nr:flagella basal body P-ring formation protein FlgA [Clostridiales bacterium]